MEEQEHRPRIVSFFREFNDIWSKSSDLLASKTMAQAQKLKSREPSRKRDGYKSFISEFTQILSSSAMTLQSKCTQKISEFAAHRPMQRKKSPLGPLEFPQDVANITAASFEICAEKAFMSKVSEIAAKTKEIQAGNEVPEAVKPVEVEKAEVIEEQARVVPVESSPLHLPPPDEQPGDSHLNESSKHAAAKESLTELNDLPSVNAGKNNEETPQDTPSRYVEGQTSIMGEIDREIAREEREQDENKAPKQSSREHQDTERMKSGVKASGSRMSERRGSHTAHMSNHPSSRESGSRPLKLKPLTHVAPPAKKATKDYEGDEEMSAPAEDADDVGHYEPKKIKGKAISSVRSKESLVGLRVHKDTKTSKQSLFEDDIYSEISLKNRVESKMTSHFGSDSPDLGRKDTEKQALLRSYEMSRENLAKQLQELEMKIQQLSPKTIENASKSDRRKNRPLLVELKSDGKGEETLITGVQHNVRETSAHEPVVLDELLQKKTRIGEEELRDKKRKILDEIKRWNQHKKDKEKRMEMKRQQMIDSIKAELGDYRSKLEKDEEVRKQERKNRLLGQLEQLEVKKKERNEYYKLQDEGSNIDSMVHYYLLSKVKKEPEPSGVPQVKSSNISPSNMESKKNLVLAEKRELFAKQHVEAERKKNLFQKRLQYGEEVKAMNQEEAEWQRRMIEEKKREEAMFPVVRQKILEEPDKKKKKYEPFKNLRRPRGAALPKIVVYNPHDVL